MEMTTLQLSFLVFWIFLLAFSLFAIRNSKSMKPKSKFFVYVVVFLVPVVGGLLILFMLYLDNDLFWQNSASQDNMWNAKKELESSDHGDIE
ncbi:MAG: hypothetical protein CL598_12405 [Alteromonas sp.]|nr:hypothetical protein [Alteromonas sp.]|tara:strand:- start:53 stop:328 length:276 start_codon:yes stop_codon:yes gene_type:complete